MAVRKPLPEPRRRPSTSGAEAAYTAEQIQVLEGREHVRRRPSMYIGSTSSTGLHHPGTEGGGNAIHAALAGHAPKGRVTPHSHGSVEGEGHGRGTPGGTPTEAEQSRLQ